MCNFIPIIVKSINFINKNAFSFLWGHAAEKFIIYLSITKIIRKIKPNVIAYKEILFPIGLLSNAN